MIDKSQQLEDLKDWLQKPTSKIFIDAIKGCINQQSDRLVSTYNPNTTETDISLTIGGIRAMQNLITFLECTEEADVRSFLQLYHPNFTENDK
jgi:hypothetical protein